MSILKNDISLNFDWREVAWQYNTGNGYQHKQDLISVFANGFEYIKQKVEAIWEQAGEFDKEFLEELVWQFRLSFPISGRVEGVNYYDDLLLMLIDKYESKRLANSQPLIEQPQLTGSKRGPNKKTQDQKEQTEKYYMSEVRDAIAKSIKNGKEPDKAKIEQSILKRLIDNKGYTGRTLRDHLPASKRDKLFGEIYRQVLEIIRLNNKQLTLKNGKV